MQADQPQRQKFTIDGSRFSNMAGFYDEVEQVFTCGLDWKSVGTWTLSTIFYGAVLGGMSMDSPSTSSGWPMKKASVISERRRWTPLWKSF